jgi:anti-sigma B factor antagonist
MNTVPASLMVAEFDQYVCIKIKGRANFVSSLDLKKLVAELWDHGRSRFILDLSDCLTMDSTFLGVLSSIGTHGTNGASCEDVTCQEIDLVNPNSRIAETLENLGVSHLFNIRLAEELNPDNFKPVAPTPEATPAEVTRNCLEAHETLMCINPENVRKFKDVAQFLAEDLKRIESREKK